MKTLLACILLAGGLAWPQDLSVGKLLLASPKLQDADFAQSVILVVRHDRQTTLGLMLNRPLNIPLSEVYPDMQGAQIKLYAGGPLALGIRALYRSRVKPEQATRIVADISMITNKSLLAQLVGAGTPSNVFRVYAGYVGWSPRQLEDELRRGLWLLIAGDAGAVFDAHPETEWRRLMGRAAPRRSL